MDPETNAPIIELQSTIMNYIESGVENFLVKELTKEEKAAIKTLNFLTIKPTMYIANVAEDGFENNPYLDKVREIAAAEDAVVIPVCAAIESELSELEEEDKLEFMADLGLEEPGLNLVIRGGYELLKLQTYSLIVTLGVIRATKYG